MNRVIFSIQAFPLATFNVPKFNERNRGAALNSTRWGGVESLGVEPEVVVWMGQGKIFTIVLGIRMLGPQLVALSREV